jgi:hypothetical protein
MHRPNIRDNVFWNDGSAALESLAAEVTIHGGGILNMLGTSRTVKSLMAAARFSTTW